MRRASSDFHRSTPGMNGMFQYPHPIVAQFMLSVSPPISGSNASGRPALTDAYATECTNGYVATHTQLTATTTTTVTAAAETTTTKHKRNQTATCTKAKHYR